MPADTRTRPITLSSKQVAQAVLTCIRARQPVCVHGPVGTAKTAAIESLLATHNVSYQIEYTAHLDPTDASGLPFPDHTTQTVKWYRTRLASQATQAAAALPTNQPHVILADEYNRGSLQVQNTLMNAILRGHIGADTLPTNVVWVLLVNDAQDSTGVNPLSEAGRSRVVHVYQAFDDADDWVQWAEGRSTPHTHTPSTQPTPAPAHTPLPLPVTFCDHYADNAIGNIRPEVIAYLREHPNHIHALALTATNDGIDGARMMRQDDAFPNKRAWEFVSRILSATATHTPTCPQVERALICGAIGPHIGAQFCAHLAAYRALVGRIRIADILVSPTTAALPTRPDGSPDISACYAVASGLSLRADSTPNAFPAILTYAERLPREYGTLAALASVRRFPHLKDTPAYTAWQAAHLDGL